MPDETPFALAAAEGGRLEVSAANRSAHSLGVRVGMGLADARAICPRLASRPAEPDADAAALRRLARWCDRYGPHVDVEGDDGIWVDITGAAHLLGGEAALIADLCRRLRIAGLSPRPGLAGSLAAARAIARYSSARSIKARIAGAEDVRAVLAPLPVEALRLGASATVLLRRLGLKRLGQLYDLPRAGLERRFPSRLAAEAVLRRLDQALGVVPEPLAPLQPPPCFQVRAAFADPLISSEGLERALGELVGRLCDDLAAAGHGARRLALTLYRSDATSVATRIGLSRASRSGTHMLRLLGEKLASVDAGFGIDLMLLAVEASEQVAPPQEPLHLGQPGPAASGPAAERLSALIDRLASRLGPEHVLRLTEGPGNFHLKPNGVFWQGQDGALHIDVSEDYAAAAPQPRWATQSGPMLLINGALHPRFAEDGASRLMRIG